jgi:hypothetical protein
MYKSVLESGVILRISGFGNSNGEAGFYHPNPPRIEIFPGRARGYVTQDNMEMIAAGADDPLFELITLAHEYGQLSGNTGMSPLRFTDAD